MVELDIGVGSGPTRANAISFGKVIYSLSKITLLFEVMVLLLVHIRWSFISYSTSRKA